MAPSKSKKHHSRKLTKIAAFDFKGRPLDVFNSVRECSEAFNVSPSTVSNHVRDGKPLKRNGITFDEA